MKTTFAASIILASPGDQPTLAEVAIGGRSPGRPAPCPRWVGLRVEGRAACWDVVIDGEVIAGVAWSYPQPIPAFALLKDHLAFYAGPFDRCTVDGEAVTPQPGRFHGGLGHEPGRRALQGRTRQRGMVGQAQRAGRSSRAPRSATPSERQADR